MQRAIIVTNQFCRTKFIVRAMTMTMAMAMAVVIMMVVLLLLLLLLLLILLPGRSLRSCTMGDNKCSSRESLNR